MTKEEIIKQLFEEEYEGSTYESSIFSVYKELVEKCMNTYASQKLEQFVREQQTPKEDGTKEETHG